MYPLLAEEKIDGLVLEGIIRRPEEMSLTVVDVSGAPGLASDKEVLVVFALPNDPDDKDPYISFATIPPSHQEWLKDYVPLRKLSQTDGETNRYMERAMKIVGGTRSQLTGTVSVAALSVPPPATTTT